MNTGASPEQREIEQYLEDKNLPLGSCFQKYTPAEAFMYAVPTMIINSAGDARSLTLLNKVAENIMHYYTLEEKNDMSLVGLAVLHAILFAIARDTNELLANSISGFSSARVEKSVDFVIKMIAIIQAFNISTVHLLWDIDSIINLKNADK